MKVAFNDVEIVEERTNKKGRCSSLSKIIVSVNAFEQNYRRSLSPKPSSARSTGRSRSPKKTENKNVGDHNAWIRLPPEGGGATTTAGRIVVEPVASTTRRRQRRPAGGRRARHSALSPVSSKQPRPRWASAPNSATTSIMPHGGSIDNRCVYKNSSSAAAAERAPMRVVRPPPSCLERGITYPLVSDVGEEGCPPLPAALCGLHPGDHNLTRWSSTPSLSCCPRQRYQPQEEAPDQWWNVEEDEEEKLFEATTTDGHLLEGEVRSSKNCTTVPYQKTPEQQPECQERSTRRADGSLILSSSQQQQKMPPRDEHQDDDHSARSLAPPRKPRRSSSDPEQNCLLRHDMTPTLVLRVPSNRSKSTKDTKLPSSSSLADSSSLLLRTMPLTPPSCTVRGRPRSRRQSSLPDLSPVRHIKTFNPDILMLGEDITKSIAPLAIS